MFKNISSVDVAILGLAIAVTAWDLYDFQKNPNKFLDKNSSLEQSLDSQEPSETTTFSEENRNLYKGTSVNISYNLEGRDR